MRKPRVLGQRDLNYYHVMSRVVNRDYIFNDEEKEFFQKTMRKLETFMGLRVLTYCIMSNHWHVLIEVPSNKEVSDLELLSRIKLFYPKRRSLILLREYENLVADTKQTGCSMRLDLWREKYISRMGNLSVFVKELKERFSKWYNHKNERKGTLWEERFKSILVEDSECAISTIATYIELNPVRAGLVDDPCNYRFCGYAEAVAGGTKAREGIEEILFLYGQKRPWRKIIAQYRMHLFCMGEQTDERAGFNPEKVQQIIDDGGELSSYDFIRCHIRYFNDGVALGSKIFIEEVFEHNRILFSKGRKSGARKMKGAKQMGLFSLRDLRLNAIAPS